MNTINIFTEDTDLNIVKSWLCNATDGQTYPFDRFVMRIKCPQFRFDLIQEKWDEIIGHKHDYKVDDNSLEEVATAMLKRINDFIADVNGNPDKYFRFEDFYDNDGYAYVCVAETPDNGQEVVCVKSTVESAKKWVDTHKKEIKDACWQYTSTENEYSIWDENVPHGWYAYRRKMD